MPQGQPWFLQLSFDDPHRPFDDQAIAKPHDPARLSRPPHLPDTRLVARRPARYYDEVSRLDADFGRIMQVLDDRGLTLDTVILFMGDNCAALLLAAKVRFTNGAWTSP